MFFSTLESPCYALSLHVLSTSEYPCPVRYFTVHLLILSSTIHILVLSSTLLYNVHLLVPFSIIQIYIFLSCPLQCISLSCHLLYGSQFKIPFTFTENLIRPPSFLYYKDILTTESTCPLQQILFILYSIISLSQDIQTTKSTCSTQQIIFVLYSIIALDILTKEPACPSPQILHVLYSWSPGYSNYRISLSLSTDLICPLLHNIFVPRIFYLPVLHYR